MKEEARSSDLKLEISEAVCVVDELHAQEVIVAHHGHIMKQEELTIHEQT